MKKTSFFFLSSNDFTYKKITVLFSFLLLDVLTVIYYAIMISSELMNDMHFWPSTPGTFASTYVSCSQYNSHSAYSFPLELYLS